VKFKKVAVGVAAVGLAFSLAACSGGRGSTSAASGSTDNKGALVGVLMPNKTSTRWIHDGDAVKAGLVKLGYKVQLDYANDNIPTQVQQVSNDITKGAKVLIIASIDGTALSDQLDTAGKKGVKVIAYDRLINGNKNVDYYTTFDNYKVGVDQANSLLTGLGLLDASGNKTDKKGPFNVEIFAGSADDNNATFFYNGAMQVLKPLISSGQIKIPSGETNFKTVATLRWDAGVAKKRMENLLTKSYSNKDVQGVLAPYDGISRGVIAALKGSGYGSGGKKLPVITGQDSEIESVKSILAGEQYSSIFKDTSKLAETTVGMIKQIAEKKTVEVNDTKSYNNGVKVVPTMLLQPVAVDKSNIKQTLLDAKYYTDAEMS
jgi:putative multiple sugar transport system substrate-binding protein